MTSLTNRRLFKRKEDPDHGLGVAIWQCGNDSSNMFKETHRFRFVGICNCSEGGLLVETPEPIDTTESFFIKIYNHSSRNWLICRGKVIWTEKDGPHGYVNGVEILTKPNEPVELPPLNPSLSHLLDNLDFFLDLPLLNYLEQRSFWALMNCLRPKTAKAGERIIVQGEEARSLFIIEQGHGQVTIDREDEGLIITNLGPGDLVGEMAIVTGEPRMANFIAEEEMLLWELDRREFDRAMARYSELKTFLTELVSQRLESSPHSADRQVGKFLASRRIGAGAWAIVYQGKHQALKKTVAIKMLKHQMAMDEEFSNKFVREAEIIAKMNHANIVHVYDIESLYGTHFIVMEYLEGESLKQVLKRVGRLSAEKAVCSLQQICAGLGYAHGHDIVHQDIKPENLLVKDDNEIKILDFGLACPTGSENFEMEGTIQYMSPEQIDSYPVDARTDIYCLGITAFEMVTGKRPYPDENLQEMMEKRLEEDIPYPGDLQKGLPTRLSDFIVKACARAPEDRFQSCKEAAEELERIADEMGLNPNRAEQHHMSSLFLFFTEQQRSALQDLLEEFSTRASESGIRMQLADFDNVTARPSSG
ncbi:MAG: protein kinase [Thermodesulfobacteriota bacterium]